MAEVERYFLFRHGALLWKEGVIRALPNGRHKKRPPLEVALFVALPAEAILDFVRSANDNHGQT